jgi:hypothetical protein
MALLTTISACAPLITVSKGDGGGEAGANNENPPQVGRGPDPVGGGSGSGGRAAGPSVSNGASGRSATSPSAGTSGDVVGAFAIGGGAGIPGTGGASSVAGGGPVEVAGRGPVEIAGSGSLGNGGAGDICPCSRRSDEPADPQCPRGADTSSTTTIGPDGGSATLATQDGPFSIQVFANSFSQDEPITLTELSASPPAGYVDYSPIYEIAPTGLDLTKGGTIQIFYSNSLPFINPALTIYTADSVDGPWTELPDTLGNAGFNTATLTRTGFFFMGYPASSNDCQNPAGGSPFSGDDTSNYTSCPCTRHLGAAPNMFCPPGLDTATTTTIDAQGGTASVTGPADPDPFIPALVLTVPNGAVTASTDITLRELSTPTPDDYTDFSPLFEIDPPDLAFATAVTVQIFEQNVANGVVSWNDVVVYGSDSVNGPWHELDHQSPNAGLISASTTSGGFFFAGRPASDDASCH